jgi:hypothetical protein
MLIDIVTIQHIITYVGDAKRLPHISVAVRHYKADNGILTETSLLLQSHLDSALS